VTFRIDGRAMKKVGLKILCGSWLLISCLTCSASQVLFRTGPDQLMFDSNGHGLPSISTNSTGAYAATDTFTLSASSIVQAVSFSAWLDLGVKPSSVSWAITSAPGSGVITSGTGALSYVLSAPDVCGCDVYWSTFSLNVPLAAGNYWLLLSDGAPSMSWGLYKETGVSEQLRNGTPFLSWGTQSFEVRGATVPEPGALSLITDILALAALWRTRVSVG